MADQENIVELQRERLRPKRVPGPGQLWLTVRDTVLIRAFKTCGAQLEGQGIVPKTSSVEIAIYSYASLWWEAHGQLADHQAALSFSYEWGGKVTFEAGSVRESEGERITSIWFLETFPIDEPNMATKVLARTAMGVGMLLAMSNGGLMTPIEVKRRTLRNRHS